MPRTEAAQNPPLDQFTRTSCPSVSAAEPWRPRFRLEGRTPNPDLARSPRSIELRLGRSPATEVITSSVSAHEEPVSGLEARGLRDVVSRLLQDYPPEIFAYVALGNSPSLVMRAVSLEDRRATIVDLPLSELNEEAFRDFRDDAHAKANLFRYFDRYVSPEKLEGKRPLLLDYAARGRSLAIGADYLIDYYKTRGRPELAARLMLCALTPGDGALEAIVDGLPDTFIPRISAGFAGTTFLEGLRNQRWKQGFGFSAWLRAPHEHVLRGELLEAVPDLEGRRRIAEAAEAFRRARG